MEEINTELNAGTVCGLVVSCSVGIQTGQMAVPSWFSYCVD